MRSPCSVPEWLRLLLPLETPSQQEACRRHDEAYVTNSGDRRDRLYVDTRFLRELLLANMPTDRAEQYFWGVRMYGGVFWRGGDTPGAPPLTPPIPPEAP